MPYGSMDGTSMASPAACSALAAILSTTLDYQNLPRDVSRAERARALLKANCQDVGIEARFQGLVFYLGQVGRFLFSILRTVIRI